LTTPAGRPWPRRALPDRNPTIQARDLKVRLSEANVMILPDDMPPSSFQNDDGTNNNRIFPNKTIGCKYPNAELANLQGAKCDDVIFMSNPPAIRPAVYDVEGEHAVDEFGVGTVHLRPESTLGVVRVYFDDFTRDSVGICDFWTFD
jgi:hypothetical protein